MNSQLMVIDPQTAIAAAQGRKQIVSAMWRSKVLVAGVDYGLVPGSAKPSLLKPGAERLCSAFGLDPRFETLTAIEKWDGDEPLFFYRVLCRLIHIESGLEIATGIGSCNSRESKYRWRWVKEDAIPAAIDKSRLESRTGTLREFKFAVEKAETSGKYGKPAAYWKRWQDAIASGEARSVKLPTRTGALSDGYELGGTEYRVPNDDVFSLVNTLDKMAQKRALVAAVLIGANASEFFTQDIEDLPEFGGVVNIDAGEIVSSDVVIDGEIIEDTGSHVIGRGVPPAHNNPYSAAKAANGQPSAPAASAGFTYTDKVETDLIFEAKKLVTGEWKNEVVSTVRKMQAEGVFAAVQTFDEALALVVKRVNSHHQPADAQLPPPPANIGDIPF